MDEGRGWSSARLCAFVILSLLKAPAALSELASAPEVWKSRGKMEKYSAPCYRGWFREENFKSYNRSMSIAVQLLMLLLAMKVTQETRRDVREMWSKS